MEYKDDYDLYKNTAHEVDNTELSESLKSEERILFLKFNKSEREFEERRNKLKNSYKDLKKICPNLFKDCKEGHEDELILERVLMDGLFNQTLYFTNLTFEGHTRTIKVLSFRVLKVGAFWTEALPDGLTLVFRGHVDDFKGYFVIDEIRTTADSERLDYEVEINAEIRHVTSESRVDGSFLNNIILNAKSLAEYTRIKLTEWENYLFWRKKLVEKKIKGCKYFNITFNYETNRLIFSLVLDGKDEFNKFEKYLKRDIKAFNNSYSINKWHFDFNPENKNFGKPVKLGKYKGVVDGFCLKEKLNNVEGIERIDEIAYSNYKEDYYDEEYYDEDGHFNYKKVYGEILNDFNNPYIANVAYDLTEEQKKSIEEYSYDDILKKNFIESEIIDDFTKQGFLALSGVGDFVLIRRLERAIEDLKRGNSNSPNLAIWLFDIKMARVPNNKNIEITHWLNENIKNNKNQMETVEKMLNILDIGLIQGPPGTGKTTVIAEIIYQYARKGQRVLVASQSNDAVDNALDRLFDTPCIRAVRLGQKNRKKRLTREELSSNFSEESILKNLYNSISKSLDRKYISIWKQLEEKKLKYKKDTEDVRNKFKILSNIKINLNNIMRIKS